MVLEPLTLPHQVSDQSLSVKVAMNSVQVSYTRSLYLQRSALVVRLMGTERVNSLEVKLFWEFPGVQQGVHLLFFVPSRKVSDHHSHLLAVELARPAKTQNVCVVKDHVLHVKHVLILDPLPGLDEHGLLLWGQVAHEARKLSS